MGLNPFAIKFRTPSRETLLLMLAGILLAAGFAPSPTGITEFIGFIPFLFVLRRSRSIGQTFRWSYFTFFIFNFCTNYWVGSWTREADPFLMIAGSALLLAHPLFFVVPMLVYDGVRRKRGEARALLAFPFIWTAFEYAHSLGDLGYPWLSLVYSQTTFLPLVNIASITGPYAISFLIVAVNVTLYKAFLVSREGRRKLSLRLIAIASGVIVLPSLYGMSQMESFHKPETGHSLTVAVLQPNINSWDKWGGDLAALLNEYKEQIKSVLPEHPDVTVLPETAIPTFILQPRYSFEWSLFRKFLDSSRIALVTGFADIRYYTDSTLAPRSSKRLFDGTRYDVFNSSMLVERGYSEHRHHKIRLTPFGERVPYAEALTFLVDAMKWGVGISSWGVGDTKGVFSLHDSSGNERTKLWAMICYEVMFPEFVRTYVDSGAECLMELSNDGWYGYSAAPYQQHAIATLRAIENHRVLVRSTNTGISGIINFDGTTLSRTSLFEKKAIVSTIPLYREKTFYTSYGEIVGPGCLLATGLILLSLVVVRKRR